MTPLFMTPVLLFSIFMYFTTDLANDAFRMPFPVWYDTFSVSHAIYLLDTGLFTFILRNWHWKTKNSSFFIFHCSLPFNYKNPIGYTIAIAIQSTVLFHNMHFTSSMANFGIGSFLSAIALTKDLKYTLCRINESAKKKRNPTLAIENFSDFIELESTAKRLSQENHSLILVLVILFKIKFICFRLIDTFSELYEPMIVVLFLWSLISISSALFLFQMEMVE